MNQEIATTPRLWGLATEKYFYFFMGLRKGEIRKQVAMMKSRYPDDTPRQLARRFGLTPREIQVARMLMQAMTSKEIAQALGCTASTINNHRNIIRKSTLACIP